MKNFATHFRSDEARGSSYRPCRRQSASRYLLSLAKRWQFGIGLVVLQSEWMDLIALIKNEAGVRHKIAHKASPDDESLIDRRCARHSHSIAMTRRDEGGDV